MSSSKCTNNRINDEWICDALLLDFQQSSEETLQLTLYRGLRRLIAVGQISSGTRLPSSRMLASRLHIARNTAMLAIEQLAHEGFVETRAGAGCFVSSAYQARASQADLLQEHNGKNHDKRSDEKGKEDEKSRPYRTLLQSHGEGGNVKENKRENVRESKNSDDSRTGSEKSVGITFPITTTASYIATSVESNRSALSARGQRLHQLSHSSGRSRGLAFAAGLPSLSLFPWEQWRRLQQRHWRRSPTDWMRYHTEGGLLQLREVLCNYLTLSRSVQCTPDQIIITQGAQQAFSLIATLLAEKGDTVWFENPGYHGARAAFESADLVLEPVAIDEEGIAPSDRLPTPKLIYITPSHQFPTAVTLSMARRMTLLEHAERTGAWIIEDDYDSEFRYDARPLASLQGMDSAERVIYVGTFSKVMYPGLGMGYMVLPRHLADVFRRSAMRLMRDVHYPLQAAVAEFIADGAFRQHIRRCRKAYETRQLLLRAYLQPSVERGLRLSQGRAGMHLLATHTDGVDETGLVAWGKAHNMYLSPYSSHFIDSAGSPLSALQPDPARTGLVLGYAAADEDELKRACTLLNEWFA